MRYSILIALWVFLSLPASGNTIHVPADQPTIQAGILSAAPLDTVLVAPGTYMENIDFIGKPIHVISSHGPEVTVINGNQNGSVVYFRTLEGPDAMLSGFTIRNGVGTRESGGWISGGGIYCLASSPVITHNIIFGNSADGHGAGIACLPESGPTITDNLFYNNINGTDSSEGWGGAIGGRESRVTIRNNIMLYNSASYAGGAVFCKLCPTGYPIFENNLISHNEAKIRGGGLYISYCESVVIDNNSFSFNRSPTGGGFHYTNSRSSFLVNNTFYKNTDLDGTGWGGAIFCNADAYLTAANLILWDNHAGNGAEIYLGSPTKPSTMDMSYTDLNGGLDSTLVASGSVLNFGPGMIDEDPLFVDPEKNDFHISYTSACRDAGIATVPGTPMMDFEDDLRPMYAALDMGADEFCTHIYYKGKAIPGNLIEFSFVGSPGSHPFGFWLSISLLTDPLPTQWGHWFLDFPLMGPIVLGVLPSPGGVLTLPTIIPPDSPSPIDLFVQAMIGDSLSNVCTIAIQ